MTDDEWHSCSNVEPMLHWAFGKAPERPQRLFALGWCWRVAPDYFHDPDPNLFLGNDVATHWLQGFGQDMESAIQTAIRFVDAQATQQELQAAHRDAASWRQALTSYDSDLYLVAANVANATSAGPFIPPTARYPRADWTEAAVARDRSEQAELLREFVAPPSLWQWSIPYVWFAWNAGTVAKLARAIRDDRRFDLMPILADALEEAGCTDADILGHCRGPGPHVRGCWVVDLILGKT